MFNIQTKMILNTIIPLIFSNIHSTSSCPTITPMSDLNTTEYIRASWYIQEQQITTYQPENTLFLTGIEKRK